MNVKIDLSSCRNFRKAVISCLQRFIDFGSEPFSYYVIIENLSSNVFQFPFGSSCMKKLVVLSLWFGQLYFAEVR